MSAALTRILYVSRPTEEAALRLAGTMEDILRASRRNNAREAITGFLWGDGETFTQVFEGPTRAVDTLLTRIATDPRHEDMRLRLYAPAAARAFPRWSMCGMTLSEVDEALLTPADIAPDLFAVEPGAILAMLNRIAQLHGPRLDAAHARFAAG